MDLASVPLIMSRTAVNYYLYSSSSSFFDCWLVTTTRHKQPTNYKQTLPLSGCVASCLSRSSILDVCVFFMSMVFFYVVIFFDEEQKSRDVETQHPAPRTTTG